MHCRDPYGYALTTSPAAAAAYSRGLLDVLRLRSGALPRARVVGRPRPDVRAGPRGAGPAGPELCAEVDVQARLRRRPPRPRGAPTRAQPRARRGSHVAGRPAAAREAFAEHPLRRAAALDRGAHDRVRGRHRSARGGVGHRRAGAAGLRRRLVVHWAAAFVRQEQGRFDEAMASPVGPGA